MKSYHVLWGQQELLYMVWVYLSFIQHKSRKIVSNPKILVDWRDHNQLQEPCVNTTEDILSGIGNKLIGVKFLCWMDERFARIWQSPLFVPKETLKHDTA